MGLRPASTVAANLDLICEQMSTSQRPLILDEADHAASRPGMVELLRDIYEGSQAPLMLVGEEMLPSKLKKFERFHGRVLAWVPAQPVTLDDAHQLKGIYSPDVAIADDLLAHVVEIAHGSVRRLCVNLVNIQEHAMLHGLDAIDRATGATSRCIPAMRREGLTCRHQEQASWSHLEMVGGKGGQRIWEAVPAAMVSPGRYRRCNQGEIPTTKTYLQAWKGWIHSAGQRQHKPGEIKQFAFARTTVLKPHA
jgi:hypothetical protein